MRDTDRCGFVDFTLHHGTDSRARAEVAGGDPFLVIELEPGRARGADLAICPYETWDQPLTEHHERFANELVAAAEQYRDAIVEARRADLEAPPDAQGVA